ncbi:hypothetical protein LRY65_03860 [Candidatus Woesebacteria bacterium]|nr:hypothetical protein [Candidatus Woesebacteria bacterium]MCD8527318.1 hypothetical protein [Candidatus Woesebacteria bacterium]
MKYLKQAVQTSFFLFGGLAVLAVSLHFTSVRETMASTGESSTSQTSAHWFDSHMPGSVPYTMGRAVDRWQVWNADESERATFFLNYADHRMSAAEYTFEHANPELAIHTLEKAFGYLLRGYEECRQFGPEMSVSCSELEPVFVDQVQRLHALVAHFEKNTENDALRAHAITLQRRVQVFIERL